jgi:hypothetical protein
VCVCVCVCVCVTVSAPAVVPVVALAYTRCSPTSSRVVLHLLWYRKHDAVVLRAVPCSSNSIRPPPPLNIHADTHRPQRCRGCVNGSWRCCTSRTDCTRGCSIVDVNSIWRFARPQDVTTSCCGTTRTSPWCSDASARRTSRHEFSTPSIHRALQTTQSATQRRWHPSCLQQIEQVEQRCR